MGELFKSVYWLCFFVFLAFLVSLLFYGGGINGECEKALYQRVYYEFNSANPAPDRKLEAECRAVGF